jgi:phosphoribosylformylglycinamidine synthase
MIARPRVLVLRAPGTNCDAETAYAFQLAGAVPQAIHINQLIGDPSLIERFQICCISGGFSYGDDIAAGKFLALQLQTSLADALWRFHSRGSLLLGICNGFQVLLKAGLLVPNEAGGPVATLTWNDSGRYRACWVQLKADNRCCVFLRGIEQLELPIAHAEGKFVAIREQLLDSWELNHQLAIRYCRPNGTNGSVEFPHNPNGSVRGVAGICDESGRVFGLMPHPERYIDFVQHPNWTRRREDLAENGTGLRIFENAVQFFG